MLLGVRAVVHACSAHGQTHVSQHAACRGCRGVSPLTYTPWQLPEVLTLVVVRLATVHFWQALDTICSGGTRSQRVRQQPTVLHMFPDDDYSTRCRLLVLQLQRKQ